MIFFFYICNTSSSFFDNKALTIAYKCSTCFFIITPNSSLSVGVLVHINIQTHEDEQCTIQYIITHLDFSFNP